MKRNIPPLILAISLMAIYLATIAPGLTWAHFGADGGDFIAAAATGGIAHPTGYPFYLLLARLFQLIPVGSLAFRTNLFSTLTAVSAALVIYGLVTRSISTTSPHQYWLAGLASGFAFGLSPLVWSQAVITEVYTLHSLFVALLLFLSVLYPSLLIKQKIKDGLLGLVLGLAMGNHITAVFLLPVILSTTVRHKVLPTSGKGMLWTHDWHLDGWSLLRQLGWVAIGLLVYITIPLRASLQPPMNWGNPVTWDGFLWLVSGKLYQGQLFTLTISSIVERIRVLVALLLEQFGIAGLSIGLIGLIVFFKPTRLYWSMLWVSGVSCVFVILYATSDSFLYMIPAFLCFAIWIGIGLVRINDVSSHRFRFIGFLIGGGLLLTLFILAGKHWQQVDVSKDQQAERFGEDVLALAPARTIVFASGDRAVFTMWYFEYALLDRPDLVVIATDLLQFDWYQQNIRITYPDLNLPGPFPFSETVIVNNVDHPVCYIQYIQSEEIKCFPARNQTPP